MTAVLIIALSILGLFTALLFVAFASVLDITIRLLVAIDKNSPTLSIAVRNDALLKRSLQRHYARNETS
jgi:hypothetical protein